MIKLRNGGKADHSELQAGHPEHLEGSDGEIAQGRPDEKGLRYRIDRDYLIVSVAGNWNAFALEN